ncbi:MAG: hypothetical protein ACOC7X_05590 [Spirochaetota bacterium]
MAERRGDNLVKIGVMTQKDGDDRLFGEIAIELEYIDDEVLAAYLEQNNEAQNS